MLSVSETVPGGLMSFDIHLKKFSVVHSDRTNRSYLNPLPDSRIRSPLCGFDSGNDEEWGGRPVLDRVPR